MTTEKILTDPMATDLAWKYATGITEVRAIEQAVLQSPEIQSMQEDSDRYHALRQMNWFDSPLCVVVDPIQNLKLGAFCPSLGELDKAIDAAMEQPA